jgi:hypothetical protein
MGSKAAGKHAEGHRAEGNGGGWNAAHAKSP